MHVLHLLTLLSSFYYLVSQCKKKRITEHRFSLRKVCFIFRSYDNTFGVRYVYSVVYAKGTLGVLLVSIKLAQIGIMNWKTFLIQL